jgi:hypothetical protein
MRLEPLGKDSSLDDQRVRTHQPTEATTPPISVDIKQKLVLIELTRLLEWRKLDLIPTVSQLAPKHLRT